MCSNGQDSPCLDLRRVLHTTTQIERFCTVRREARLYVCSNGQGSPCLDLQRVPDTLYKEF